MGDLHQLIIEHGRERARLEVNPKEQHLVDVAAHVLENESDAIGITYSGFCVSSLPHKRLPGGDAWRRDGPRLTLIVEPGRVVDNAGRDGTRIVGVPYGSRARLILLYLQTEALRSGSRQVELGRSMHAWLGRMGIPVGGKSYRLIREQAERITACRLSFFWHRNHGGQAFARDSIIEGGLAFHEHDDAHQASLWSEYVYLSPAYYSALQRHPVPLWEPALRHLAGSSLALDAYAWLAYRLHILEQPAVISWPALYAQFGGGFKAMFHFKPAFSAAIKLALAVYPEARVKTDEAGMTLFSSPPPLGRRGLKALQVRAVP
jgi:hypothetical protein